MAETARSLFRDGNNTTDVATPTVALPPTSTDDLDDAGGPSRVLERTLSSSSVGSSAAGTGVAGAGESLAIAAATPPLDSAESALILRLARVFSCLLLFGVSHNVLHDCRAVVSVLRNTTPPLVRACASPPTDVDGLSTPLWTVALLRGGERCAMFACATLNHARRLLFALNGSAQSSIGAIPALRRREPALCDALLRSAERAQRRAESITPLAATVSRAVPPQAAAHLSVDDANRNRFRATAEQATYNNRERQRDEFMQIQRAWLENAPANASADDKVQLELRQLAVDELTSSVRQFVARTDPLNLPWLGAMLREQLLAAAVADPLDEQDEAIKAMASAEKLRKLRGRIDGARGATGATTSSHGARKPNQRARMPAATAAVAAARRRSFAQLFVGASSSSRNSAAMSFVYEFAEAALHEGGHLHAALASVLVSGLRELLRTTGADGAATRHDLPALRAALARQTSQLCALARFLGFVQALPLFHVYPQTSDVPLDGGVDVVDAMAWPLRPAPFIEAAARNGTLVLTLPWVCALLSAWHNERVLSESRIVQETIDALRAVAPCDVLRSRELSATVTLPRVFAVNTLASTFAAIGEVVDLPPLRALDGAKSLRVSLRVSGFVEADGGAVSPEPQATPDSKASGSELIAAPDDFEDLLDDDFVRLCFEPLDALAHAAAQLNDESGGVSRGSPSRPTKKITLTTAVVVRPRALSMAAPATTRLSPNEPDSGEQEQLRRWFAWQHPQLATLAETVSSNVARSALAFISEENAVLRSDIAAARARLLARIAIGDAVARVQFERLARETLVAVLPSEVEQLHARVAEWARTAITEFVDARVRTALPLLLPATLSDSVMRAAVAHTRSMALSQVLNSGAQRAAHIVVNTVSAELTKAARLCRRDTLSWSESAPTIEAAIQCLYAATMLFEPSDSACLQALQATTSTNPALCERIRVLAHVADDSGGASASDTGGVVALRCVAAAIDALLLTLDAEPKLRDRGRWQPLLPRATLALGEAVAHALPRATSAQQATALCALVRRACVKVAAFDVRLVRNVHYIVQDARHAAPHACVKQLLDDIEATTQNPQKE
jgi:hypothetical protein